MQTQQLTAIIPALPARCGSWVATSPAGRVVELFDRRNAEKAALAGWSVVTTLTHLTWLNKPA